MPQSLPCQSPSKTPIDGTKSPTNLATWRQPMQWFHWAYAKWLTALEGDGTSPVVSTDHVLGFWNRPSSHPRHLLALDCEFHYFSGNPCGFCDRLPATRIIPRRFLANIPPKCFVRDKWNASRSLEPWLNEVLTIEPLKPLFLKPKRRREEVLPVLHRKPCGDGQSWPVPPLEPTMAILNEETSRGTLFSLSRSSR